MAPSTPLNLGGCIPSKPVTQSGGTSRGGNNGSGNGSSMQTQTPSHASGSTTAVGSTTGVNSSGSSTRTEAMNPLGMTPSTPRR
ncbi:unnamed protein product [Discula destructiva]